MYADALRLCELTITRLRDGNSAEMRGLTPARVVVVDRDISVTTRRKPSLGVAGRFKFHIADLTGALLSEIVEATATINFALPARTVSKVPWTVEQWHCMHCSEISTIRKPLAAHQAHKSWDLVVSTTGTSETSDGGVGRAKLRPFGKTRRWERIAAARSLTRLTVGRQSQGTDGRRW